MSASQVQRLFDTVYRGQRNFMTPVLVRYGVAGPYGYELSRGKGLAGEPIFGVTFLRLDGGRPDPSINQLFTSVLDADNYIREVRDEH